MTKSCTTGNEVPKIYKNDQQSIRLVSFFVSFVYIFRPAAVSTTDVADIKRAPILIILK